MTLDIRSITAEELPAFCAAWGFGFLHPSGDPEADATARRNSYVLDRTWAAFDGDQIVGTTRSFPVTLTVPGGSAVHSSAITSVSTLSTHRRRGLATRLMTTDLRAAKDRGEVLGLLHATEWPIYGRFGFGPATSECTLVVDAAAALRDPAPGTAQLVDQATARALLPEIYARNLAATPGEVSRSDWFFDIALGVVRLPGWDPLKPGFHVVVRNEQGLAVGLCRYEVQERWEQGRARHLVKADLLVAADPSGEALLWQHLLSLDLVTEIQASMRSVDDPLPYRLVDGRHVREQDRGDSLWLRLLDVPAALVARQYSAAGRLVLEIADAMGLAGGRFELVVSGDGRCQSCEPTESDADLTMDIATLGALYLGGVGVLRMHRAGLVTAHRPDDLQRADTMFHWAVTPVCTTMF